MRRDWKRKSSETVLLPNGVARPAALRKPFFAVQRESPAPFHTHIIIIVIFIVVIVIIVIKKLANYLLQVRTLALHKYGKPRNS